MDGHGSHVYNLLFVYDMYQHNVSVAVFESYTTHVTQPLNHSFFSVFEPAWQMAMTQHNIHSAFHVTGIFPLNLGAIIFILNWLILFTLLFVVTHTHTHTHTHTCKNSFSCKLYLKSTIHINIYLYIFNFSSAEDDSKMDSSEDESMTKMTQMTQSPRRNNLQRNNP